MRGAEAAKARVESALESLFEAVEDDLSVELYTEEEADEAIRRELGGSAEDWWADWKEGREDDE